MKLKYYKISKEELDAKEFEAGSLYLTTDTNQLYLDPVGGGGYAL